jgi:AraC-like DNA-binding protein
MSMSGQNLSPNGQAIRLSDRHERAPRPVVGYAHDYPDGWQTGQHSHAKVQLLHAVSGVMRIETQAATFTVPPGHGLWMPADIAHAVHMQGAVRMRALFLTDDAARAGPSATVVIVVSPLLLALIDAACAEPPDWDPGGRGPHLAALALDEISRAPVLPLALPTASDPRLRRVTELLRADPADRRDLDALADPAGASARTLARLFRRETGMSFDQWRRHLRLTTGLAMLATGRSPKAVAAACGYASVPAFGAAFRAAFGVTPGRLG